MDRYGHASLAIFGESGFGWPVKSATERSSGCSSALGPYFRPLSEVRRFDDVSRLAGCRFDAVAHVDQMLLDPAKAADNVVEFLIDGDGLGPLRPL